MSISRNYLLSESDRVAIFAALVHANRGSTDADFLALAHRFEQPHPDIESKPLWRTLSEPVQTYLFDLMTDEMRDSVRDSAMDALDDADSYYQLMGDAAIDDELVHALIYCASPDEAAEHHNFEPLDLEVLQELKLFDKHWNATTLALRYLEEYSDLTPAQLADAKKIVEQGS